MNNPFDYIKRDREKKAQQDAESKKKAQDEYERIKQQFDVIVSQYASTVIPILENLRDAAYPSKEVHQDGYYSEMMGWPNEIGWSIGYYTYERDYSVTTGKDWNSIVTDRLELSKDRAPKAFICRSPNGEIRATLTTDNLIEAMKMLHPVTF